MEEYIESLKIDIRDFENLIDNEEAEMKDVKRFLNDLKIKLNEMEKEMQEERRK